MKTLEDFRMLWMAKTWEKRLKRLDDVRERLRTGAVSEKVEVNGRKFIVRVVPADIDPDILVEAEAFLRSDGTSLFKWDVTCDGSSDGNLKGLVRPEQIDDLCALMKHAYKMAAEMMNWPEQQRNALDNSVTNPDT